MKLQDFEILFKALPIPYLILKPDPIYTIAAVNEAYCMATNSTQGDLKGKELFEVFPANPNDPDGDGVINLKLSLQTVIKTRSAHKMAVQKYDIPVRGTENFEERYWQTENLPVVDHTGELIYIIHSPTDVTQQVLAERNEKKILRELQSNQEHYKSLFENNPDAVFSFNLNGEFLSSNQALAALTESSRDELMKMTFSPFVAPEDFEKVNTCFLRASKGEIQNYNTGMITAKGNRLVVNVTNIPITVDEKIVGVYGIAKDITKAVQSEQEIVQKKQQLKNILDSSLDVICTIDEYGNFVKVSRAAEAIWGYLPEELEGRPLMNLIIKEDQEVADKIAADLRKGIKIKNIENHYQHKDGYVVTMSWSAHWDPKDKLFYCVARDITEAKSAAMTIRNNEKRFRALLQNSADGLALLDEDGTIKEVSVTGGKILNIDPDRIGHHWEDVINPGVRNMINRVINDVLINPQLTRSIEFRLQNTAKDYKWIEANFQNKLEEPAIGSIVMNFRDITERKVASEKLKSSEERYREIFYNNPTPMWLFDRKTYRFLEVNQAAINKYGYSEAEFLKMTIKDIRPKEDIDLLNSLQGIRASYGIRYQGFWRHLKKNGELIYVDINSHLIEWAEGKANLVIANDITESMKAEEAIKSSEQTLKLIMNSSLDAVISMAPEGYVTSWSDQAEKIFGWKREEVLGEQLADLIVPEAYRKRHQEGLKRYLETGTGSYINKIVEVTAIDRNKIEFPIELTIVPIISGNTQFFCAFIRDVTERKHFITELNLSEKRYKTLVQEGSDLINILDKNGNYKYVSPTYLVQLGYKEEELMERYVFELIHPEDRGHVLDSFQKIQTENRVKTKPFRFLRADMEYCWLESVGTNMLNEQGIEGIVVTSRDITERMNYIQAIEEQNSRLREIAWTQSHVVRAPLSRIMALVDVLTNYPEHQSKDLFNALILSAHELDAMIRKIVKNAEQINGDNIGKQSMQGSLIH